MTSKLPVWCAGVAAPASVNGLTFVGWQEPIACGGCAIFPGDVIVVDDDGAVVIPQALVEFVAHEGAEHELYESWVFTEVEKGVKLPGLYPPNDDAKARYAAWRQVARIDANAAAASRRHADGSANVLHPLQDTRLFRAAVECADGDRACSVSILLCTRFRRLASWLVVTSLVLIAFAGYSPLGNILILPLEAAFPALGSVRMVRRTALSSSAARSCRTYR